MISVWSKFRNALRAYRSAHEGNVAITFALATLPIIATVGFAVDYSHANSVKVAMQSALDSTALMLSKEAATDTTTQLQQNAVKYFTALFTRPEATNVSITANYTSTGGTSLVVNGSAVVPTALLGIIGYSNITVSGSSTAKWGSNMLRVALVLDNTGSMADDGKMTALISATKSLLTQLQSAATNNGDVYVSIVPFVKDVNLDPSNYNSNYIYWGTTAQDPSLSDNNSWDANNGSCSSPYSSSQTRSSCLSHASCSISGYNSQNSCTGAGTCSISGYSSSNSCTNAAACSNPAETTSNNCTSKKACSNSSYTSSSQCTNHGYTWGYGTWSKGVWTAGVWTAATWTPDNHNTWNGCVMDRGNSTSPDTTNNYDTNAASPSSSPLVTSSLYPAEQYSSCPQAVMGLNYNWSGMTSLVNNMSPNGNTNQAIGLQLGWMSLVGGGPFTVPAMQSGYTYSQVIILLTDGLNTQDRWYTSQNSIDARQTLTCNNIKAAGITLYTIQVNTGGDPTSSLLQSCASTSDKFYLLTSASQIITAFTAIGSNLTQLRVAK
jgi:Flp pilus assembly protein TadG